MKLRPSCLAFLLTGVLALPCVLRAGEATVSAPRESASEAEDIGEVVEAPPDNGVQGSKFRMNASVRSTFTTNADLSGSHSSSDVIFFPAVEVGYSTGLSHGFAFDVTGIIESGVYASHDDRSFIGYSAQTTLSWSYRPKWPRFY